MEDFKPDCFPFEARGYVGDYVFQGVFVCALMDDAVHVKVEVVDFGEAVFVDFLVD